MIIEYVFGLAYAILESSANFRYFFRKFSKFFSVESRLTNKTQLVVGFELRQVVCAVDYGRSVIAPTVCRYHLGMVRRAYYHYMKPVGIMLTHNVVNFDDERARGVHDAVSLFDYFARTSPYPRRARE